MSRVTHSMKNIFAGESALDFGDSHRPLRVVYCKNGFDAIDGSAEHLVNYAVGVHREGHSVEVILLNPCPKDNQYYGRLVENRIPVRTVARLPFAYLLRLARRAALLRDKVQGTSSQVAWNTIAEQVIARQVARSKADLVHTFVDAGVLMAIRASKRAGVPVLCQECISPRTEPSSDGTYDELARLLPSCAGFAAQTPRLAEECAIRIPFAGRVEILPNIVEDPQSSLSGKSGEKEEVVFGFAARLEERKDPATLIRAFARVLRTCPRAKLKLAGSGPLEQELRALSDRLGLGSHCEFVGPYLASAERAATLRSFDVLVHPALVEGTPNTVLEAMTHRLAIVATALPGIQEALSVGSAILFAPKDVDALSDALICLAGDRHLRQRMGENARLDWQEKYSPSAVMPSLMKLYRSIRTKHDSGPASRVQAKCATNAGRR